jgi:Protein of unknown function (DUF1266)
MSVCAYVMLALAAAAFGYQHRDTLRALFGEPLRLKRDGSLGAAESWAIAAGADLAQRNRQYLDSLPSGLAEPSRILFEWWGISSRDQALAAIRDLASGGHRSTYQSLVNVISTQPAAHHVSVLADNPELQAAYGAVRGAVELLRTDGLLGAADAPSMLAWDLGRLINICRWCFDVNLLTARECWAYVLPAAAALQAEYRSWGELSTGYLLGFLIWKGGEPDVEYELLKANRELLLRDARSPWQQLPWSTAIEHAAGPSGLA